jgi:putative ABC transport system ATP-binding protein
VGSVRIDGVWKLTGLEILEEQRLCFLMISISELQFSYLNPNPNASSFGMRVDSLSVSQGSSTALVGPSGSGKTTLLALIAGTLRAESGNISVNRLKITDFNDSELGRFRIGNVGQVFQAFELLNYLTVTENVMLPWYISGSGDKAAMRIRAVDLLSGVGLESKLNSMPDELSQGEQQRVAVCRAMLNNPPVLLADEPTGNLDQENKQNVVDLLVEQARDNNSTLLMVTHDESLLGKFDSVLDMRDVAQPLGDQRQ